MKTIFISIIYFSFGLFLLVQCSKKLTDSEKQEITNQSIIANDFFPMKVGNKWQYKNLDGEIWEIRLTQQILINAIQVYSGDDDDIGFGIENNIIYWYPFFNKAQGRVPVIDGNLKVGEDSNINYINQEGELDTVRIERLANSTETVEAGIFNCVRYFNSDFDMDDLYLAEDIGFIRIINTGFDKETLELIEFDLQ
ncbi:hypothetical protein ACFL0J_00825 [Candidatus Neomarinimicrobiota bacterium]